MFLSNLKARTHIPIFGGSALESALETALESALESAYSSFELADSNTDAPVGM